MGQFAIADCPILLWKSFILPVSLLPDHACDVIVSEIDCAIHEVRVIEMPGSLIRTINFSGKNR